MLSRNTYGSHNISSTRETCLNFLKAHPDIRVVDIAILSYQGRHKMAEELKETMVYCSDGKEPTQELNKSAPRIDNFKGKRIGLLWNGKPNGDSFLNRVAELLMKRYKDSKIIKFREMDPTGIMHADRKTDYALDFMAKNADIVIASIAD